MRAKMSKGRITVPKAVRDGLDLREGDVVVSRVEGAQAVMARTPDLLHLAGCVAVPASKRGASWDEVRRSVRRDRAASSR
jgi:AbrB family looped-hinge helix DNA binding protein